jgi:hypothetical protein
MESDEEKHAAKEQRQSSCPCDHYKMVSCHGWSTAKSRSPARRANGLQSSWFLSSAASKLEADWIKMAQEAEKRLGKG